MSDANFDADLDREARECNFDKLCGKNGELVELRRKQMLIGAARLLKNNCRENDCGDCLFWQIRGYGGCQLQFTAKDWDMPEVQDDEHGQKH